MLIHKRTILHGWKDNVGKAQRRFGRIVQSVVDISLFCKEGWNNRRDAPLSIRGRIIRIEGKRGERTNKRRNEGRRETTLQRYTRMYRWWNFRFAKIISWRARWNTREISRRYPKIKHRNRLVIGIPEGIDVCPSLPLPFPEMKCTGNLYMLVILLVWRKLKWPMCRIVNSPITGVRDNKARIEGTRRFGIDRPDRFIPVQRFHFRCIVIFRFFYNRPFFARTCSVGLFPIINGALFDWVSNEITRMLN